MSDKRVMLWCVNSAYVFILLFLFGWVYLAGFVPPPSPQAGSAEISGFYNHNLVGIRVGMIASMYASALLLPWGGAVSTQIMRIEGPHAPLMWGWVAAQGCVVIEFIYPCIFWLTAAFRPEDTVRVQTFNDLGWLPFMGVVCTGIFQMFALAIVTLRDRRAAPVFPRWFAYFQFWSAAAVGLTFGVYLFKSGPLAWNGILAFWVSVTAYFIWLVVTTILTARAIKNDDEFGAGIDISSRLVAIEAELADFRSRASSSKS